MDLKSIIDEIADQADDFLEGVTSREQARAAISEQITIHHSQLNGIQRGKVIDGVFTVLEREGFFDIGSSSSESGDSDVTDSDE